ncbi:MAG: hypothetical protein AMXMBFR7_16930 [Planctomycetota bacterium]
MDTPIFSAHGEFLGYPFNFVLTAWKLFGYVGIILFAGSWLIQLLQSRAAGRPVISKWFWLSRMSGSLMLCSYFLFSPKQDSVGIWSNVFPVFVAAYNLYLEARYKRTNGTSSPAEKADLPPAKTLAKPASKPALKPASKMRKPDRAKDEVRAAIVKPVTAE